MKSVEEISVQDYSKQLQEGTADQLLDVRTLDEFRHANIGGTHIPLQELQDRHTELPKETPLTIMCHHGRRSEQACFLLQELGYTVRNLIGGIDAWSCHIDNSISRY